VLPAVEIETGACPAYTVIWLHGLGADGNDFVPIIDEFEFASRSSIRFIFPHAPERPVSINNGYVMRAWYDIYHSDFAHSQDEISIHDSKKAIEALIEREIERGIASQHILLAGFSQGGAMALHVGLQQTRPFGGIIALSCYLPFVEVLSCTATAREELPIFMAHGIFDTVIPLSYARFSKEKLLAAHYSVEWHEYPIAHTVSSSEIADIDRWVQYIVLGHHRR